MDENSLAYKRKLYIEIGVKYYFPTYGTQPHNVVIALWTKTKTKKEINEIKEVNPIAKTCGFVKVERLSLCSFCAALLNPITGNIVAINAKIQMGIFGKSYFVIREEAQLIVNAMYAK